ncbi:MAG: acetylxylan esterase [Verrucomicrobia bacterium]|nr:acetylxylan esterase [Verrucomicrobiota bacterium]
MTTSICRARPAFFLALVSLVVAAFLPLPARAAAPRALPDGQLPADHRLEPLKELDGYFPFTPSKSPAAWNDRAERVRRQLLVSLGLWPRPKRTPLNAVIHGKQDFGDYTVEKVYFESVPGFFVTGSLYRPKNKTGKVPAVLCPHGHWPTGRFMDAGLDGVRKQIVIGAERFEEGGRTPILSRCVQLARMGCVAFFYDMIGYADSQQISYDIAHRFAKQRPEMNSPENWGLFSPQAEAHLQSIMGLQTWNSMRVVDFLLTLPDVDASRLAVTGASGGGTQTMLLAGLDPRLAVSVPCVMVSTAMQGGCTCENAALLRVDTGNVEFAALFAPKPQAMSCADDWTKEMFTKGFPQLQQHYKMLGAPANVHLIRGEHFKHNYNYVTRAEMYSWLNKHLKLGLKEPVIEEDHKRLTQAELTVWDAQHPAPPSGPDFERQLCRWLADDAAKQLKESQTSPEKFREAYGGAVDVLIGRNLAEAGEVEWDLREKKSHASHLEMTGLLRNKTHAEDVPVVFLHPKQWSGQTVLWPTDSGKAGLYNAEGRVTADVQKLLDTGATVVGVDLFMQGEFLADGKPLDKTRRTKNPRQAACFTHGYNHALFAQRVHDLLTVVKFVKSSDKPSKSIDLVGFGAAGPWVAAARAQARSAIDRAVVDTGGFRFGKVNDLQDVNFLPGGAKYGDLPGMIALHAPGKLWLAGEDATGLALVKKSYELAGAAKHLAVFSGIASEARTAALAWLQK